MSQMDRYASYPQRHNKAKKRYVFCVAVCITLKVPHGSFFLSDSFHASELWGCGVWDVGRGMKVLYASGLLVLGCRLWCPIFTNLRILKTLHFVLLIAFCSNLSQGL